MPTLPEAQLLIQCGALVIVILMWRRMIAKEDTDIIERNKREERLVTALEKSVNDNTELTKGVIKGTTEQNELLKGMRKDIQTTNNLLINRLIKDGSGEHEKV